MGPDIHDTEDFEIEEKARKTKQSEVMARSININGTQVTLGELFPDGYGATEFASKLDLLFKGTGGSSATESEEE